MLALRSIAGFFSSSFDPKAAGSVPRHLLPSDVCVNSLLNMWLWSRRSHGDASAPLTRVMRAFTLSPICRTLSELSQGHMVGGGGVLASPNRTRRDCLVCDNDLKPHLYVGEAGRQQPPPRSPLGVRVDVEPLGGTVDLEFLLRDAQVEVDPQESTSDFAASPERCFCSVVFMGLLSLSKAISKQETFHPLQFGLFRV